MHVSGSASGSGSGSTCVKDCRGSPHWIPPSPLPLLENVLLLWPDVGVGCRRMFRFVSFRFFVWFVGLGWGAWLMVVLPSGNDVAVLQSPQACRS